MVATLIDAVCDRGFRPALPDGRYNLWTDIGDHVVVDHPGDVVQELINGSAAAAFWLDDSIDLLVSIDWATAPGHAHTQWNLDARWTRPTPGSPWPWLELRNLITDAWIDAADRLHAEHGQLGRVSGVA